MCGCLLRTAVACLGCCTPLLYGMTAASKNTVKGSVDIDPSLISYRHFVGHRAHLGIWLPVSGSWLWLGRSLCSSPDREHLFCAEDFQHPGQRALRTQQHQLAAALAQRLGGKQEHPDARRIREIQPAYVDGQVERPVASWLVTSSLSLSAVVMSTSPVSTISGPDSPAVTDA
jgi:hypothetical protein